MSEQNSNDNRTVRVPVTALLAVQQMLSSEGLEELAKEISGTGQVDFQPTISTAGRLGIDVSGIREGKTSFVEGLEATRRLSETHVIAKLSPHKQASAKVKVSLIENLQAKIKSKPGLIERNAVAMAVSKCKTADPFNCPKDWPNATG